LNTILKDFSQSKVNAAIERNIIEQYPFIFSPVSDFEMHETEKLVWFVTGFPHSYLNYVLRAQFKNDEIDTGIEATLQQFRTRHVPVTWSVGPSTVPIDIGRHLISHGLIRTRTEMGMALDLLDMRENFSSPPGLIIERVQDKNALRKWLHIVAVSFEYPDSVVDMLSDLYSHPSFNQHQRWQIFIGFLKGEPVGASRLFVGAGVAGIYHVATVPEVRSRGIGTAMTVAPLREARNMGCRIGVLRAAENARGIYSRIGFKEYCPFQFFTWRTDKDDMNNS
jgi:ribosomal protein S18 acetylase RimI-like enzyme